MHLGPIESMKSSVIPADSGYPAALEVRPSGGVVESLPETVLEESPNSIPHHPLGVKPSGNQYTAATNSRISLGPALRLFPDELLAIFLEYLDAHQLRVLGSCCKFLYAFCRSDDLWKALFIE
jgi:hypothetical protein